MFKQLYIDASQSNPLDLHKSYVALMGKYSIEALDFVFYDLFSYEPTHPNQTNPRDDMRFKRAVSGYYNATCPISGTDMPCDICHIYPYANSSAIEKYDPHNGIVMRTDLHRLFDAKQLKINPVTMCVEMSHDIMGNAKRAEYHRYNGLRVQVNPRSVKYLERVYCV